MVEITTQGDASTPFTIKDVRGLTRDCTASEVLTGLEIHNDVVRQFALEGGDIEGVKGEGQAPMDGIGGVEHDDGDGDGIIEGDEGDATKKGTKEGEHGDGDSYGVLSKVKR